MVPESKDYRCSRESTCSTPITIRAIRRLLRTFGYTVVPVEEFRPSAWGSVPVLGSFPPFSEHGCVGDPENYFIHNGYKSRPTALYFDDTPHAEESQLEVYLLAKEICDREGLTRVCDIGCGSAYKLIKYLGGLKTVGLDLPQTYHWLENKYPDRCWMESDFRTKPEFPIDLVIASDVIEHLENPNGLMDYISSLQPRYIILSTPDRNLLRTGTHNGPPANPGHVREWSFLEFQSYVKQHFEILEHFISSAPQATQCILCRPKNLSSAASGTE